MNKTSEYIVYEGNAFVIEWYFDPSNKSEALEYYNSLDANDRRQLLKLVKRMGDVGEIKDTTKFRNEGDKIYAFKPQPNRFLCFFNEDQKIIITNGFRKKQNKLPVNEKNNALNKREEYLNRVQSGDYYD
jgi:phage-related protein